MYSDYQESCLRSIITRKLISFGIHRHAGKKVMLEFGYAYYFLKSAVESQFAFFLGRLHKVLI